jgi:uncharacterized protein (DUF885 family)
MRRAFLLFTALTLFSACSKNTDVKVVDKPTAADSLVKVLADDFLNGYLQRNPQSAVALGFHEFDGKLEVMTKTAIAEELAFYNGIEKKLLAIDTAQLSRASYFDYRLMQAELRNLYFSMVEQDAHHRNPMDYAGALSLDIYIKRNFAPLEERVKSIIRIEKEAPAIFKAARENLRDSLAKPFVETAIEIAKGSAEFLKGDLLVALNDVKNDSLMKAFRVANTQAIAELESFAKYLEKEKLPKAHTRYALGKAKYQKMLDAEFIALPPEKILEIGLRELKKEQTIFAETARRIDTTKPAIEVFKAIQKDHPTAENLIADTKRNLEAIRTFLVKRKIITIPSEERVRVEETPQFARATSFASMDTPGPFETKATEAYYYVTPVEKNWTPKKKEEWLTAFNYYTTDVVSIHEAYPGHYFQFLHLNKSSASKLQKIFSSYAFVKGWAHYTEQMVLDEGFGADTSALVGAKYRLAQSDEALLRLCRLCVSVKTHCDGMSIDDATKFFMENCYYEEAAARAEATRGTYDPGYCFYTLGKLQLLKLREDYKRQQGSSYSLQKFNDEVVAYGMPPVRLLREKLLRDKRLWNDIL